MQKNYFGAPIPNRVMNGNQVLWLTTHLSLENPFNNPLDVKSSIDKLIFHQFDQNFTFSLPSKA